MARRTAKQKAATRKLVALNKKRKAKKSRVGHMIMTIKRRKSSTRSSKKRRKTANKQRKTVNKTNTKRKSMAKRKSSASRFRRAKSGIGSIFSKGPVGKVVMGVGAATVAGIAVNAIAPQFAGIAKPLAAFAAGGPIGAITSVLLDNGGLSNISGLLGGLGGGQVKQEISL